jgi:hypothetical protein
VGDIVKKLTDWMVDTWAGRCLLVVCVVLSVAFYIGGAAAVVDSHVPKPAARR